MPASCLLTHAGTSRTVEFEFDLLVDTATNVAAEMVSSLAGSGHTAHCICPRAVMLLLPYCSALPLPGGPAPHKTALC